MKKKFRVAIIASAPEVKTIYKTMCLAFGIDNVEFSLRPEDLFGMLKRLKPTTLIIEPELFYLCSMSPEDIKAYQKEIRYHILTVYPSTASLEIREHFSSLNPSKEYINPTEYLTMAMEIPKLCTNRYKRTKAPFKEETKKNLERILQECGFRKRIKGIKFLQEALCKLYFNPDLHKRGGATKIYQEIAIRHQTTPRIVERAILRCLESSWSNQTEQALRKELSIPDFYDFSPMNFGSFTQIFNTYYTIKYGEPEKNLKTSNKKTS